MRDRYEEFGAKGAGVAAIGMGWPEIAAGFKKDFRIPFPVLVDQRKESYKALRLRKASPMELYGPRVWLPFVKSLLERNPQGIPKVDHTQLAGTIVIAPSGAVRYRHAAENVADSPPVDDLLRALE